MILKGTQFPDGVDSVGLVECSQPETPEFLIDSGFLAAL